MRILVTGGRKYPDCARVWSVLDDCLSRHKSLTLIEGGATGADFFAREWAYKNAHRVELIHVSADWDNLSHKNALIRIRADGSRYDARAGLRRNQKMIDQQPDLVIAFPGNKGTIDCVSRATDAGITVIKIGW